MRQAAARDFALSAVALGRLVTTMVAGASEAADDDGAPGGLRNKTVPAVRWMHGPAVLRSVDTH